MIISLNYLLDVNEPKLFSYYYIHSQLHFSSKTLKNVKIAEKFLMTTAYELHFYIFYFLVTDPSLGLKILKRYMQPNFALFP